MVTPAARATTSTEVPAIDALEGPDRLRAGWSVQDLVSQLSSLFWVVVDPSVLPDTAGLPTERAQDVCVAARRDWSPQRVLDDHEVVSAKALDALRAIEPQDFELPLGDLGTFHASVLPNAYTFDHYTYIRADLCAPRGPLRSSPPSDELRLAPTIDWIANAAPQQNGEVLAGLGGAIEIDVRGTAGRTFLLGDGERSPTSAAAATAWCCGRPSGPAGTTSTSRRPAKRVRSPSRSGSTCSDTHDGGGKPPVAIGPQRSIVRRMRHLPCRSIAARYSAQSGCSPEMLR